MVYRLMQAKLGWRKSTGHYTELLAKMQKEKSYLVHPSSGVKGL